MMVMMNGGDGNDDHDRDDVDRLKDRQLKEG